MDLRSYNQRSDSNPQVAIESAVGEKKSPLRRSKDQERSSNYLRFDDFKEYRRRCMNPYKEMSPDHHFYKTAVKDY